MIVVNVTIENFFELVKTSFLFIAILVILTFAKTNYILSGSKISMNRKHVSIYLNLLHVLIYKYYSSLKSPYFAVEIGH